MLTQTDNKLETYQTFGDKLHVNFDETEITISNLDGTKRPAYEYTTAVSTVYANRDQLIEDIIRSKYALSSELAVMNNQVDRPENYAEFQAFRNQAKSLADGWFSNLYVQ